jgi:spermidine/putrescine transport system permease protein
MSSVLQHSSPNKKGIKSAYLAVVYLILYLPIAIVVLYSFNNSRFSQLWHGFTWHWYRVLFSDHDIMTVTLHSLTIGFIAATIAALIGSMTAVALLRYRFKGKKLLHGLLLILIVMPNIAMAIAFLLFFTVFHLRFGFWTLLIAHITFSIPFVAVIVYNQIVTLNKHLFDAAHDLGANDRLIFTRIIFPLIWPATLAGWLLSFTLSIDDVIISYFVSGPNYSILPLKIYSMVRVGVNPEINALSTLLLFATLSIVMVAQLLLRKKR